MRSEVGRRLRSVLGADAIVNLVKFAIPFVSISDRAIYDFTGGYGESWDEYTEVGYLIVPEYDGVLYIGEGSKHGGFVIVADDDNFTMLSSAWCQRATSWSKNISGIVDQEYKHWSFSDWFMGPFAEKVGLKMKDSKFIFKGNATLDKNVEMEQLVKKLRGMKNFAKKIAEQPNPGA